MNKWVKIGLGLAGAGIAAVVGAIFLGKKRNNDDECAEVEEIEDIDSDSDEEAE